MKKLRLLGALCSLAGALPFVAGIVLLCFATASQANIIYDVNRTIGAGTVTGFFETDGTLGALSAANFLDWSLTVTAPNINGGVSSVSSMLGGSTLFVSSGVTASLTDILYDFSGTDIFYTFTNTNDFWCVAGNSSGCFSSGAEVIGYDDLIFDAAQTEFYSGIQSIVTTAVPVPAALWLFGSGLLGLVGMARRKKT